MLSRAKGRSSPKLSKACCPSRATGLCLRDRNCLCLCPVLCLCSCCHLEKPQPYCTETTDVIKGEPPLCEESEEEQETESVCSDIPYLLVSEERYRGGLPAQAAGCCLRKGRRVHLVVSENHLHGDIVLHRPPQSPWPTEHTAPQCSLLPEGTAEMARAAEGPLPSTLFPAQPAGLQARPHATAATAGAEFPLCPGTGTCSTQKLNLSSSKENLIFFFGYCVVMFALLYFFKYF
ncbi:uncharacterized protein LOC132532854 [Erinaceus europaeus]|uniref:Uncharacterized protein LOC132532854 n=1 Tax=Erinaceus europaeus TaxID=9365 RepID=A0ABM3VV65_ERIEU|nr:uncharacterized protein LOC132532854 [Erinaceus europaeus]